MGRGLSNLQRSVLKLALQNRSEGRTPDNIVDVYYHEILARHFGWEPLRPIFNASGGCNKPSLRGQKFDKQAIGEERYYSVVASLSRSIARLESRGLVRVYRDYSSRWTGVALTNAGIQEARRLSVNMVESYRRVNR